MTVNFEIKTCVGSLFSAEDKSFVVSSLRQRLCPVVSCTKNSTINSSQTQERIIAITSHSEAELKVMSFSVWRCAGD